MNKIEKTKVLFIIPTLTFGGAERVIVTLLKHLDRRQFQLSIVVLDMRNEVFKSDIPADVELIELNAQRVRHAVPKIISLIWKYRPNVVFTTLGHLNLALAMVRPLLPSRVRYIARETSIVSYMLKAQRWPTGWAMLYRLFYKRIDLLVCQSQFMQNDLVELFGYPRQRSVVINNPIDVDFVKNLSTFPLKYSCKQAGKFWLVAAGRMANVKGFDLLIEAIALLADSRVHVSLLGDGPLLNELKCLAEIRGVSDQINFLGFQSNPYAWFARADAFVLSSRHEGFPNVALEALACGTPVIATPAPGGIREILGNIAQCKIADSVSAEALASAIRDWIRGDKARVPFAAIAPYVIEQIVGEYESVLQKSEAR